MKKYALFVILFFCIFRINAQQSNFKLGLTLSGGGAKGLAHIGILQAIDSAGLNVDYITGTSMGSIVGGLYAVGYSGNDIEKIARELDWGVLFAGKPHMSNVNISEKDEFANYALEIPFEKGKIQIGTGLLEGQEIWVKFQEFFWRVYDIKDFNKFSIPFRCIATDLGTGKAVVLDQGEIVTALRASMAIPSVFTAIDYKDTKLIDGGVVRNFPVRDVIKMGANYTIGVTVSKPLNKAEDLNSALDVLYQIGFYKDADDFFEELKLCDELINVPMEGYSAASFGDAEKLIELGKEWGKKYYPQFKKLADSLKLADPSYTFRNNRLPDIKKIELDSVSIYGLENTSKKSFLNTLNVTSGKSYDGIAIGESVRKIYGSENFTRISYYWEPTNPGKANLKFNVIEKPLTKFKVALNYHTFSKMALITTVQVKNLLFDRSKTTLKLNISENYRILLEQNQTFGQKEDNNLIFSGYFESFKYPIYINFQETYLYRNNFLQFNLRAQHTFNQRSAIGVGTAYESINLIPKVFGPISVEAGNSDIYSYSYFDFNTLNEKLFPTKGWKIHAELGYVYNQKPDDLYVAASELTTTIDTLNYEGYGRLQFKIDHCSSVKPKLTLLQQINSGINFNEDNVFLNYFFVGGLNDFVRNQITFAGLNEYEVYTNSIASGQIGVQYNLLKSFYTTLRANVALYNFASTNPESWNSKNNLLSGYSLTVSYSSGIGPIEFSLLYSDQSKKVEGYINVGFHF